MSNILVTGGCGFIGTNLVQMLHTAGHRVTIFDNFSSGNCNSLSESKDIVVTEGDICDESALQEAMQEKNAVIHLAAAGSVVESVINPVKNFVTNAEGTFKVLNAARLAGVRQFIFSSTGGALIGNASPPVNETSVPRPISPYGASKLAGEGYCCAFAHAYDMSVTALRFANVVGPVSWHKKGAVTAFFKSIMKGEPLQIYGDGSATRDFLYVDDLCRGIIAALQPVSKKFRVFHLSRGYETSVLDLAKTACRIAGVPDHPIVFNDRRAGEVERNFADYSLAAKELGFCPQVSLEDALRYTWEWMQIFYSKGSF